MGSLAQRTQRKTRRECGLSLRRTIATSADLDWTGLDFPKEDFEQLQKVYRLAWRSEIIGHEELFLDLHEGLPKEMLYERELLICRM